MRADLLQDFGGRSGQNPVTDRPQVRESWMGEVGLQLAPDPRNLRKVAGLGGNKAKPHEDAKDAQGALGPERGVVGGKGLGVSLSSGVASIISRQASVPCFGPDFPPFMPRTPVAILRRALA